MKNLRTYFIIFLLGFYVYANAQLKIEISQPQVVFNTSGIAVIEAGSDFTGTAESRNEVLIKVDSDNTWDKLGSNYDWYIDVHKLSSQGGSPVELEIMRTGTGNRIGGGPAGGLVRGGDTYRQVTDFPAYFFCGRQGGRENIPLRFRINKLSVLHPVDEMVTVVFTVTLTQVCN